ncbi:MAG: hypothetical protein V1908_00840 [Candidatus Peregrinibacteria bacterium]
MADQNTNPNPQGTGTGANPVGGQGQQGAQGAQGAQGKDLSGIMEENVDISSLIANAGNQSQQQDFLTKVKVPPHPNTKFDEKQFIQLLAGSISLTVNEKYRIVEAIPQLSQFQIDELIKIFKEEQQKFAELEKKHAEQVAELERQHKVNPEEMSAKQEEERKRQEEEAKAEAIKKSLGL